MMPEPPLNVKPRQAIRDDSIPEQRVWHFSLQFFRAVPATPENKKALEDIFRTSI